MKAFELHTYTGGKWKIDSVFDSRELALHEARRVDEGSRYSGVRVIEENHDDSTDLTTTRTIFRGGTVERLEQAGYGKTSGKQHPTVRHGAASLEAGENRLPRKNKSSANIVIPVLVLSVLIIAGLTALVGLQELSQLG